MARRRFPWQKLWWSDYVEHPQLKLCSWAAQGVWPRMLAIMWFSAPRGLLLVDGREPSIEELAVLWGKPEASIAPLLLELEARGVFSRNEAGIPYCRRMVREDADRSALEDTTATEREVADAAVQAAMAALNADAKRKAGGRKRTREYRQRQRAKAVLEQMRALAHMEVAVAIGDIARDVTGRVTVTSQGCGVTSPISLPISDLGGVSAEAESESRISVNPERRSA